MAVLVTGAGGFIGRAVLRALDRSGAKTLALLGPDDEGTPVAGLTFRGDVRDPELVSRAVQHASALIHLAGPASVAESFANPSLYASVHVEGSRRVFEAARRWSLERAVLVSSAEVYGQPDLQPVSETARPAPRSPYAEAKLGAEIAAQAVMPGRTTIVRPFSVYGPGMRRGSVLGRILDQTAAGGPVRLQTLEPVRDYVHVDDLAALICLCLGSRQPGPDIVNGCSGQGISVGALGRLTVEIAGAGGPVETTGSEPPRTTDIQRLVGDPSVALARGWPGARPLRQGLADLIDGGWEADR